MNEGGDSVESTTESPIMPDTDERMNAQPTANGNEFESNTASDVTIIPTKLQLTENNEEDPEPDSDNTMNAETMNTAVGHSVEKMNAAFALGSKISNSETFGMMNKPKVGTVEQPVPKTVQIMVQVPFCFSFIQS